MLVYLPVIVVHVAVSIGSIFMSSFSSKVDIIILNNHCLFPEPIHGVMGIMPANRVPCLQWLPMGHVKLFLQVHQPTKTIG